MARKLQGISALRAMFEQAHSQGRAAFLPYFPIGYPDYATSLDIITAMAEAGVDGFEIGIPFSDPLADGTVIQAATQKALEQGTSVRQCLQAVRDLRQRGVHQPMLMMGYANPLVAFGTERFIEAAYEAGADGIIVPDLPPEEAHYFSSACAKQGMAQIFLCAPTSNAERLHLIAERSTGFIYVVSLTGITGARRDLPPDLTDFIARIRQATQTPLVLGFGISTPEHARQMNGLVEGFIVGSAVVRAAGEGVDKVADLVRALRQALVKADE